MAARKLTSDWVEGMLALPEAQRRKAIRLLPPRVRAEIPYTWELWGRADQVWRPGGELWTVTEAGRGWGKSRHLVEAIKYVARNPQFCGGRKPRGPNDKTCGQGGIIGIAGRTAGDTRETLLFGPSGLITNSPPAFRPAYYPARARLEWPNGVVGRLFSGDEPKTFLGANLGFLGLDELAHWQNLAEAIAMFELTLRHGDRPRGVIATTPVAELAYLRFLYQFGENDAPTLDDAGQPIPRDNVRIVHGSTYDNAANLAPDFLLSTVRRFEGTALGDQELRGLVQLESRDAIWRRGWIRRCELAPPLKRVAIIVDPAVSSGEGSAETGITVWGEAVGGDLFLLDDASGHYTEGVWSDLVVALAELHGADLIAAEENQGGTLVKAAILRAIERAKGQGTPAGARLARAGKAAKVQLVRATQDKAQRAALVVGMWEHGHVWHVGDPRRFVKLEHQLCTFNPNRPHKKQPSDRLDSAVWGVLVLAGDGTDRKPVAALSLAQGWAKIAEQLRRQGAR